MRGWLQNLSMIALATSLTLGAGECAARVALRGITTTADNGSYFALAWKRANVRLNRHGFREREFPVAKPPGSFRIAFIGDSYAFGQGIAESERMSNLLQQALIKDAPGVEVLNFGNAGNNTADELMVLRTVLRDATPDFVILQWFVNDVEYKPPVTGVEPAVAPDESLVKNARRWLRNSSVLYFLAGEVAHRIQDALGPTYTDDLAQRTAGPGSRDWLAHEQALIDFIRLCRDKGTGVALVLVPAVMPLAGREYPLLSLHERVRDVCGREEVMCVDLLDVFRPFMDDPQRYQVLWVNRFDPHMSAEANRLATDRILAALGPTLRSGAARATAPAGVAATGTRP